MALKAIYFLAAALLGTTALAQSGNPPRLPTSNPASVARPKLVVGLVIDQMRWDFLYRYIDRYQPNGGFKRLLSQGFAAQQTLIPYTPTVTAAGHTCLYTGSVPAIHGITGNAWYDNLQNRNVYCSEDPSVEGVGGRGSNGKMSPKNMLTTTVGDELRLSNNFRSKVIGIAIKDRGAILPAGHSANAAYWYDGATGNFVTSTYYMTELPAWVNSFNSRKLTDSLFRLGWNTLYPINTYLQSTTDVQDYEGRPLGKSQAGFPYKLDSFVSKSYGTIASIPQGNTLTLAMAKAALTSEYLGKGSFTDMLCVSLSSPDYIGHSFGPNSIETEDGYLRLDREIGLFLDALDAQVGKGNYTLFLSADHGVAHVPAFMTANRLPGGVFDDVVSVKAMNDSLTGRFGPGKWIVSDYNYNITLNHKLIDSVGADESTMRKWVVYYLQKQPGVARAFDLKELMLVAIPQYMREMLANGWYPSRSGDIQVILKPGYIESHGSGTTHGLWNPYDSHIPCLFYGWGIKPGQTNRTTYMYDVAPTLCALLKIQMPSGCIGRVIEEAMANR